MQNVLIFQKIYKSLNKTKINKRIFKEFAFETKYLCKYTFKGGGDK